MKLEDLEKQLEDLYIQIGSCNHSSEIDHCMIDETSNLENKIHQIKFPKKVTLKLNENQCRDCFSEMIYCEGCQIYSCHKCDHYGTCMCN